MQQKTVLISGASGNLGQAVKAYFLQQGRLVSGLVHHSENEEKVIENYIESTVDLTDKNQAERVVSEVAKTLKRIDTAVLTTGGFALGNLETTSIDDLRKQYSLNFETAYNLTKPILKIMKEQGSGSLFFIGSGQGMDTRKGTSAVAYSLSKSLLFQLANIINADSEGTNIKAFVVVPNIIDTPQNRQSMPEANFDNWQKPESIARIIGRYAETPEQFANTTIIIQEEL